MDQQPVVHSQILNKKGWMGRCQSLHTKEGDDQNPPTTPNTLGSFRIQQVAHFAFGKMSIFPIQ
ncbi:hypothetical protein FRX31_031427 [Thalictrum thalictroides]|uniref:Uncharacterized protein n=1 Tax=Thalictrum thalictroides TaxID=46969 RepID=A0A7J6V2G0_THATH|nr:hypothetical protein FRX31_031427 [Thalictrum thalictroides]